MSDWKDTNPKTSFGNAKLGISDVPLGPIRLMAAVMRHGRDKYGHYNWREAGVTDVVYLDAMWRHFSAWWEGEDIDHDVLDPETGDVIHQGSGQPHLAHVMACAAILMDAKAHGMLNEVRLATEVLGQPSKPDLTPDDPPVKVIVGDEIEPPKRPKMPEVTRPKGATK